MSNCICGANNLYKLFEYCHLAESILFPIHVYCKHRWNKYKSWLNFKMKTPQKNIQANPPKSQLSVTFYHLNIKEKIKYFKTKRVNSQLASSKPLLTASSTTFWLQTLPHCPPPGHQWAPSPHSGYSCWASWCLEKDKCLVVPP